MYSCEIPLRLPSVANLREHHHARAARAREHRNVVRMKLGEWVAAFREASRLRVTITRIGPKALDTDNLASACKACRDGVADALGRDDGDPRIVWSYAQARYANRPRTYGLRIEIEGGEG